MRILFLAVQMVKGSGVSVVINELASQLKCNGIDVIIGCKEADGFYGRHQVHVLDPTPEAVAKLARSQEVKTIVAHTSPFFEVLPDLQGEFTCWAWEHGEPSPEFFPDKDFSDGETVRRQREATKRQFVYPRIHRVIAISDFIRNDINWSSAEVICNGCDHVYDFGPKRRQDFVDSKPLRIGTLMRLGPGEARYKGQELLFALNNELKLRGLGISLEVMGKGNQVLADEYESLGIRTHINASNEQRSHFLREIDIFLSLSKWEGFNLPIVEAQASGTVGLALDTGAHPEVTPFVFQNPAEILQMIEVYQRNRQLLYLHSKSAYEFVRQNFSWARAALDFQRLLAEGGRISIRSDQDRVRLLPKALMFARKHGLKATAQKIIKLSLAKARTKILYRST